MLSLMIVVLAAFFIPIVLHRMQWIAIPVVVAEIAIGLILGKSGFGLIEQVPTLELLSNLGIIYLMFLTGLEIDFELIRASKKGCDSSKPNPLWISVFTFVGIFVLALLIAWVIAMLGIVKAPFFMTLIIATISVSVTLPVLKDKGILDVPLGQTILLTAVIADLVTMILLAIYVAFRRSSEGITSMLLIGGLFLAVFLIYWFLIRFVKPSNMIKKIQRETISIGTRGVFALIIFFVALSESVGAENILGAFLAGALVSLLSPDKGFISQLNAFGYGFLVPIFFVMVGVKLDLWGLLNNTQSLLLLPLLLGAFYLSKALVIPIFSRFFGWKRAVASAVLLGSTLSLVIAASAVGEQLGMINATTNTALILAAVITVLTSPMVFQRLVPDEEAVNCVRASLIGFNPVTMQLARDLTRGGYTVTLYGSDKSNLQHMEGSSFKMVELPSNDIDTLKNAKVFDAEIVVAFTKVDEDNLLIAAAAEEQGVNQVIARHETKVNLPEQSQIKVISAFFSNVTLVKAMIEHPSLIDLVTTQEHLQEIRMNNRAYHFIRIRDLDMLGQSLVLRILRGNEVITPHGDTVIHLGDRLIVSDTPEHARRLRRLLGS
ncbi:monovalent cation:proton antiporter family protein [Marininema halotolerans]|uniref:Monovalent cation:H+ antiporter-2, CPA2 family/trk system potassium uptake protein TrkA n=1 Tax=Marininema halotolerans TaxID=1155944 RepID=A0A1I6NWM3_9BACL|nr:monovalent cation:proton antiporter family protein [Marininema halotolerans]SFS32304.1 monovalent cation:H+ antiporter-2, CPA2 family/trk system potassium uptake protein TrkA [Marininema halotolerans]